MITIVNDTTPFFHIPNTNVIYLRIPYGLQQKQYRITSYDKAIKSKHVKLLNYLLLDIEK